MMSFLKIAKRSVLLNSIINLLVIDGINYLLPFLALPFLYRTLGAQVYGSVATAYSFFSFLAIFVDFGFGLSATRDVSLNSKNPSKLNRIVSTTFFAKIILLIIGLLVSTIVIENSSFKIFSSIFYLMMGIPIGSCLFPVWYFQGVEKMSYMTTTTTMAKLLSFIPMFIVVKSPQDGYLVAIFYSCGFLLSGILSVVILKIKFGVKFVKINMKELLGVFKTSAPYFFSRISASLYGVGNTVLIGLYCGPLLAGCYDTANKIIIIFSSLLSPLTTALYPYMIKRKNIVLFKKMTLFLSLGGIIFCILSSYFAKEILFVIFGEAREITVTVLRILLLDTAFIIPNYMFGYPLLAALGHTKYTNYSVIIAGLIYIMCVAVTLLMDKFSVLYAAIFYVSCEFVVFLIRINGIIKFKILK